jgi:hypothetical protein
LLAVFNWPEKTDRYQKVAKFVDALFSRIGEFPRPPRHPKWKEASITAVVPGWQRFKAAQDWLDQHPTDTASQASRSKFKEFMAQEGHGDISPQQLDRLYERFLEWNNRSASH